MSCSVAPAETNRPDPIYRFSRKPDRSVSARVARCTEKFSVTTGCCVEVGHWVVACVCILSKINFATWWEGRIEKRILLSVPNWQAIRVLRN